LKRWETLRGNLYPLITEEPDIEGVLWPIFLMANGKGGGCPTFLFFVRDLIRGVVKQRRSYSFNRRICYAIHGAIPSHINTLWATVLELSGRGLNGSILGPYPFKVIARGGSGNQHSWPQEGFEVLRDSLSLGTLVKIFLKSWRISRRLSSVLSLSMPDRNGANIRARSIHNVTYGALKWAEAIRVMLRESSPEVLIAGLDLGYILNPLVRISRQMGTKTIVLQHGNQGEYAGSARSDFVVVWGEFFKERTLELGVPEEKIRVLGSPRIDQELQRLSNPEVRAKARFEMGIPDEEIVVLHISDGDLSKVVSPEILQTIWTEVPKALYNIDMLKGVHVAVKLHPGEGGDRWKSVLAGSHCRFVDGASDIYELIAAADIVTCVSSVAGLEAAYLGRPVVFFRPQSCVIAEDFPAHGVGIGVDRPEGIVQIVEILANNSQERASVVCRSLKAVEYFFSNRGRSGSVVVDFVESLLDPRWVGNAVGSQEGPPDEV